MRTIVIVLASGQHETHLHFTFGTPRGSKKRRVTNDWKNMLPYFAQDTSNQHLLWPLVEIEIVPGWKKFVRRQSGSKSGPTSRCPTVSPRKWCGYSLHTALLYCSGGLIPTKKDVSTWRGQRRSDRWRRHADLNGTLLLGTSEKLAATHITIIIGQMKPDPETGYPEQMYLSHGW